METIQDNNKIVSKAFVLDDQVSSESPSRQLDDPFKEAYLSGEAIEPPYDPETWSTLMESSPMLKGCIETKALNTVGLGWKIVPVANVDSFDDTYKKEKAFLEALFDKPNNQMPFSRLMTNIKIDEEAIGNGYLEVVRNSKKKIITLYHVPGHSVRRRSKKNGGGFIQIRDTDKVYFKEFGDTRDMSSSTGKFKNVGIEDRASEIIHFKLYYPKSSYYGAPSYVSASTAITGNRLAAIRNIKFFENDAVPRMVLLANNAEFDDESIRLMKEFFANKSKGAAKAHRVLVVQASKKNQFSSSNSSIDLQPLTVGVTDDASFLKYQKWNDDELRKIFRIPPPLVGMYEDINKASAYGARRIANEQVFLPDQREKEYIINQTIVADLGITKARLQFVDMEAFDPVERSEIDNKYANIGGYTPNDIRDKLGKDRYKGEWANMPLVVVKELAKEIAKDPKLVQTFRDEFFEDIEDETTQPPKDEDRA